MLWKYSYTKAIPFIKFEELFRVVLRHANGLKRDREVCAHEPVYIAPLNYS